jgi:hypothetical protein
VRSRVVFPAPDGPTIEMNSPADDVVRAVEVLEIANLEEVARRRVSH